MRITPLDVRKQDFRRSVRGYDCDEVRAFLITVADEYEAVLVDNKELRERIIEQGEKIAEYSNMEKALRDTLMTAERLMKESKQSARKEGELIVRDAGLKARKVLDEAQARAADIRREILGLKKEKDAFLARVRSLAQAQIHFIDSHGRDFSDVDRRLFGQAEPRPAATAPAGTDRAATVDEPADDPPAQWGAAEQSPGPVSQVSGDAQEPQDDVWRNYIPGNLYASPVADGDRHRAVAASVDGTLSGTAPISAARTEPDADDESAAPEGPPAGAEADETASDEATDDYGAQAVDEALRDSAEVADSSPAAATVADATDDTAEDASDPAEQRRSRSGYRDYFGFGTVANDAALEAVLEARSIDAEPAATQDAADADSGHESDAETAGRGPQQVDRPAF